VAGAFCGFRWTLAALTIVLLALLALAFGVRLIPRV
jgi:hypothetical protein